MSITVKLDNGTNIEVDSGEWIEFQSGVRAQTLTERQWWLSMSRHADGRGLVSIRSEPSGEVFGEVIQRGGDWVQPLLRTAGRAGLPTVWEDWVELAAKARA